MGKLKVASLFCGCGGMDLGILGDFNYLDNYYKKHPVEIVYAIDNDKYVCGIYNANFSHKCENMDIKQKSSFEIPSHHVLIGGFPCQSFSVVAQNPPRLGYKDEKGKLFFEMCRIIEERKPVCFIAENVKGIISANKGKAFPLILKKFSNDSYYVTYKVLNSADYGVPQKRERVFIVGFRNPGILANFKFPEPINPLNRVPLSRVVFPEETIDEKYYFSEKAVMGMQKVKEKMNKGREQDINNPCNTIGAHLAKVSINSTDPVLKINGRYRRFTPREAARIQSFPEEFILVESEAQQYKAIGNAVPPVLMWHVTNEVIKAIKKTDKKILESQPYRTNEEIRSYNMSKIRSKDTKIELILRKALWSRGHRFRKNYKELPGTPDVVFKSKKIAIFCDSSFWHGKDPNESISRIKTNKSYWGNKIRKNRERDAKINTELREDGWAVLRFWDSQILEDTDSVIKEIEKLL